MTRVLSALLWPLTAAWITVLVREMTVPYTFGGVYWKMFWKFDTFGGRP